MAVAQEYLPLHLRRETGRDVVRNVMERPPNADGIPPQDPLQDPPLLQDHGQRDNAAVKWIRITPNQRAALLAAGARVEDVALRLARPQDNVKSSPERPNARVRHTVLAARCIESFVDPLALINGVQPYIRELMTRSQRIFLLNRKSQNPLLVFLDVGLNKINGSLTARITLATEVVPTDDFAVDIPPTYPIRYCGHVEHLKDILQPFQQLNCWDGIVTFESEGDRIVHPHFMAFPASALLSSQFANRQVTVKTKYGTTPAQVVELGLKLSTLNAEVYKHGSSLRALLPDVVSYDILNSIKRLSPLINDVIAEAPISGRSSNGLSSEADDAASDHQAKPKMILRKANAPTFSETAVKAIIAACGATFVKMYENAALISFPNPEEAAKYAGRTINGGHYIIEALAPRG